MADLRSLIAAHERAAAAAGERGEKQHLLLDADQNIGNQLKVLTPAATIPAMTIPTQNPDRLLNLNAASKSGQIVTVSLGASADPVAKAQPSCFITGVVEFGNGSRFSTLELDIPIGPFQENAILGGSSTVNPQDGGVLISLPAGTLRVYARSDATLITPNILGNLPDPSLQPPQDLAADVLVTAFAGYFTRPSILAPTKTLWLGKTGVAPVNFVNAGPGLAGIYSIPAFAKTIRMLRSTVAATAITINILDASLNNILDTIIIPAATRSDTYKLPGNAAFFAFAAGTTTPMTANTSIQAVFELQI